MKKYLLWLEALNENRKLQIKYLKYDLSYKIFLIEKNVTKVVFNIKN